MCSLRNGSYITSILTSARPNGLLAGQGEYEEGGLESQKLGNRGRGGPWSIEGGDLGSGGLSGGCDGFTTPFTATNPTQPWVFSRKCSMASHWIWGLFLVTYCDPCRITSPDPIPHKCTPTSSSVPLSLSCSRAAPCGAPFLHPAPLCVSSRLSIRSDHNVCAILAISRKSRSFLVSWMISHTEKLIWASFYSLVPDIWPFGRVLVLDFKSRSVFFVFDLFLFVLLIARSQVDNGRVIRLPSFERFSGLQACRTFQL